MKSMWPPSVAIFFMTNFYRAEGGHGPLGPTGSATVNSSNKMNILEFLLNRAESENLKITEA